MRGWEHEHGAGESPFLGQAGGGCGAGGAFLAGRAAGTNVFPTWPRIPGSARSHGQDAPAATPAPAASFPRRGEGRGGVWWSTCVRGDGGREVVKEEMVVVVTVPVITMTVVRVVMVVVIPHTRPQTSPLHLFQSCGHC